MSVVTAGRRVEAREVALQVVRDVFGDAPRGAHEALDYRLRAASLDARDRSFATELAYGAIRMRRRLDYELAPFVGERAKTLPRPIAEILRLGAYQLRFMRGVEAYAAVSESVGLARRYGHKGTAGLVNAVLRRVAEAPERPIDGDDDDAVALRASLPTWIVAHWRRRFGAEHLAAILAGVNAPPALGICVDPARTTAADAAASLSGAGYAASVSPFCDQAVIVRGSVAPAAIEALGAGAWHLQAEAATFPVDLLDPHPGERVFEACGGRGNKTLQLLSRLGESGTVESVDRDERRVIAARQRLAAAGVASRALTLVGDAATATAAADCDRALVDAPCSSLGIIGRQPESRWRKDPADPARLAAQQAAILAAAAARVRPGGTLVYAVCSTDPREGDDVVAGFLAVDGAWRRGAVPSRYAPFATESGDIRTLPGIDGRDGFFIARLERGG